MVWNTAAAALVGLTGLLAFPQSASAITSTCTASNAEVCSTGVVAANRTSHKVVMAVWVARDSNDGVCIVWDQRSWVEVGRLTATSNIVKTKTISGLYGTYAMGCYLPSKKGFVGGNLSNNY